MAERKFVRQKGVKNKPNKIIVRSMPDKAKRAAKKALSG